MKDVGNIYIHYVHPDDDIFNSSYDDKRNPSSVIVGLRMLFVPIIKIRSGRHKMKKKWST
jgi:hypothetical protein